MGARSHQLLAKLDRSASPQGVCVGRVNQAQDRDGAVAQIAQARLQLAQRPAAMFVIAFLDGRNQRQVFAVLSAQLRERRSG